MLKKSALYKSRRLQATPRLFEAADIAHNEVKGKLVDTKPVSRVNKISISELSRTAKSIDI